MTFIKTGIDHFYSEISAQWQRNNMLLINPSIIDWCFKIGPQNDVGCFVLLSLTDIHPTRYNPSIIDDTGACLWDFE
jgi:hypothetical protein